MQSDKATVEITSRFDGIVKSVNFEVGDLAPVGASLISIEVDGDGDSAGDGDGPVAEPEAPSPVAETSSPAAPPTGGDDRTAAKILTTPAVWGWS